METVEPPRYGPVRPAVSKLPLALAAGACVIAALVAAVGSFVPLFHGELRARGSTIGEIVITGWGFYTTGGTPVGAFGLNIFPLLVATALLALAAVVLLLEVLGGPGDVIEKVRTVTSTAGAAFLTGVTMTILIQILGWRSSMRVTGEAARNPDFTAHGSIGIGFWLLVAATALAIVSVALTLRRPQLPSHPPTPDSGYIQPVWHPGVAPVPGHPVMPGTQSYPRSPAPRAHRTPAPRVTPEAWQPPAGEQHQG